MSLVGHWKLDERTGTLAADDTISGNDGTLVNSPVWSFGRTSFSALRFSGGTSDERVMCGNNYGNNGTSTQSWTAWIKLSSHGTWKYFIGKQSQSGSQPGYSFYIDSTGRFGGQIRNAPTNRLSKVDTAVIPLNVWVHLAVTYDGSRDLSGFKLYKDGVLVTSFSSTQDNLSNTISESEEFTIGKRNISASNTEHHGYIDDVRVYDHELSLSEVEAIVNEAPTIYAVSEVQQNATDNEGTNTGTWESISIPTEAEYVVFAIGTYRSGDTAYFSAGSVDLDGTAMDYLGGVELSGHKSAFFGLDVSAMSGTVDLDWDWDGTASMNGTDFPGQMIFFSGVDLTDPVRDIASTNTSSAADLSAGPVTSASGDWIVARVTAYQGGSNNMSIDSGETVIDTDTTEGVQHAILVAEAGPGSDFTIDASNDSNWYSLVAMSLRS
jgi:hypothetical protein